MAEYKPTSSTKTVEEQELVIERIFDAPRDLVWKAWTEPERLMQWWGPKGSTLTVARLVFRPGGVFHYSMRAPNGQERWGKCVYREITAPKRMVYMNSFSDAEGNLTRDPLSATWPIEILNTLTLSEREGKTNLTLRGSPYCANEAERKTFDDARSGVQQGFKGTLDQLSNYLAKAQNKGEIPLGKTNLIAEPGKQELVTTRFFDVPPERVFNVYTDPKLIPQWWGPKKYITEVDTMEFRPGGLWRFVQRDASGHEYAFHGVYHAIQPPERLVQTFEFEATPGHVLLQTVTFEEHNSQTKLTNQLVFQSVGDRDGMLQSGMEAGESESMDRLAELLAVVGSAK